MGVRRWRCLCGAVTYEIEGDPMIVAHCHCTDSQRISGAGHTVDGRNVPCGQDPDRGQRVGVSPAI